MNPALEEASSTVGRAAARDLLARHAAGAAARPARAADPRDADRARAVRDAARSSACRRAINVFSTRIYFELNPDTDLPAYGRAAAVALPFLAAGMVLLLALQPRDPARRPLRHRHRQGLSAARARARPLAAAGARSSSSSMLAFAAVLPALVLVWTSLFGYAPPSLAGAAAHQPRRLSRRSSPTRGSGWPSRNTFLVARASAPASSR